MKINETTLLEEAFTRSFGFMLNRIWDEYELTGDPHSNESMKECSREKCFTEFICALEEMGVELEDITATSSKEEVP